MPAFAGMTEPGHDKGLGEGLTDLHQLLRVLWAENRRALGSGNAFGKSAKGVRRQPLPSAKRP
jgi:hypothetical protein